MDGSGSLASAWGGIGYTWTGRQAGRHARKVTRNKKYFKHPAVFFV